MGNDLITAVVGVIGGQYQRAFLRRGGGFFFRLGFGLGLFLGLLIGFEFVIFLFRRRQLRQIGDLGFLFFGQHIVMGAGFGDGIAAA